MSTLSTQSTAEAELATGSRPPRRRWLVLGAMVAVLMTVGLIVAVTNPMKIGQTSSAASGNGVATSLATVEKRSLSAQTQVSGLLGYAGDFSVVNLASQGPGQGDQANTKVATALPAVGQVVNQGEVLYRVNGYPVVLLYGATPAYRDLAAGAYASDVKGPDVQQLKAALVALGYADTSTLDPNSDEFTWATAQAIKKLQAALGVKQTGALMLGQVVFLPSAVRVTSVQATLGAPAQPGATVLKATSTTPVVTVGLDPARQTQVKQGDAVSITLPNLTTTPGTVSSVGTVATTAGTGGQGHAAVAVEITLTDPAAAGGLDQAPVLVSITTASVESALVVPVTALLALAGGGYAVEVVGADGLHKLVPVSLGIFNDRAGLVQVTGSELAAGQRVVVPAT